MAVIFDQMRLQVRAILAIDDGAAGGAGVALVGGDQVEGMTEQCDMLVIDRGDAGRERADQARHVVAPADAGLEHRELARRLLKMQAGQREQRFEAAELFAAPRRDARDRRFDPGYQSRQIGIADVGAIDLNPFVETIEMRRSTQSRAQAVGPADAGAECRGGALAVGAGDDHRDARQPRAVDGEGVEQFGHSRQAHAVAEFRKIKHRKAPSRKKYGARFSGSDRRGRIAPADGSTGWN